MFLTKIDRGVAKIEGLVLTFLLLMMIVLSAYQVITRNWEVFHSIPEAFWLKAGWQVETSTFLNKMREMSGWLSSVLPPFIWGDLVVRSLVLWLGFVGASIAAQEGGHLAIDFVTHFTPKHFKKYSSLIISIASAVVCYFLMIAAYKFFQDEKLSEGFIIPDLIPHYWAVAIIPFGFMMMGIRFVIKALEAIECIFWKRETQE